jgi:hypothetical protein
MRSPVFAKRDAAGSGRSSVAASLVARGYALLRVVVRCRFRIEPIWAEVIFADNPCGQKHLHLLRV